MAPTPYRTATPPAPEPPRAEAHPPLDLTSIMAFAWVVTLVRIVAGLLRAEPPNRELDLAWLILLLAPVVIGRELLAARRARRAMEQRTG